MTVRATKGPRAVSLYQTVDETRTQRSFDGRRRRAAELIVLYEGSAVPSRPEKRFLFQTGLARRADFIEALACEADSSCSVDLELWLGLVEPYWRNQPGCRATDRSRL
jgi:hypothetical protein